MVDDDRALSATLAALADPTRRALLARLAQGDLTVTELAEPYDMTLAAVSKHLRVLEAAGLVSKSRIGQARPCHLELAPLSAVSAYVEEIRAFWERSTDRLTLYLAELEAEDAKRRAADTTKAGSTKAGSTKAAKTRPEKTKSHAKSHPKRGARR